MKFTYIIIGAAVIGIGVWGYCYMQSKKNQEIKDSTPAKKENEGKISDMTDDTVIPDIKDFANESFNNIAGQHQVASEILKEMVEEIKITSNEAEQKKKEIDDLLNDLSK